MAREVRASLAYRPRSIAPKYFYDDAGCRLFDEICNLPEYYPTRAERSLLEQHAGSIVREAKAVSLIEIGSGMARKTGPLLRAMCDRSASPTYVPFDIAPEAIERSARMLLAEYPGLRVRGVVGDFAHDCSPTGSLGAEVRSVESPRIFAFLGSTIGNLDEVESRSLLSRFASMMGERDRFLLGVDLVKDPAVLRAAYNDTQGVTAAFNKNVLRVISRELDGEIDESCFEHLALYDDACARIEMHLVSARDQRLVLRAADLSIDVAKGERILTEISRKFTRATAERLVADGGMKLSEWISDGRFALCVAKIARSS